MHELRELPSLMIEMTVHSKLTPSPDLQLTIVMPRSQYLGRASAELLAIARATVTGRRWERHCCCQHQQNREDLAREANYPCE